MSMNEVYEIGQEIATTSEYTEILTMIHTELLRLNEGIEYLCAVGWVIAGCVAGVMALYGLYKLIST